MTVQSIRRYPDPILTQLCEPVLFDATTEKLATDLADTMFAKGGKGLAAPQIGVSLRMFVLRYQNRALAFCNPVIVKRGKDLVKDTERCLSIPGKIAMISRNNIIEVECFDVFGNPQAPLKFRGIDARCVQHEIDHLDGKLII